MRNCSTLTKAMMMNNTQLAADAMPYWPNPNFW